MPDDGRSISPNVASLNILVHDVINLLYYELFKSFLERYQEGLEEAMRGSNFIFDSVDSLYYDLNKISLNRGGSYKDSPKQLKNKKTTINPKNKDDKCFQYVITVALNKNPKH